MSSGNHRDVSKGWWYVDERAMSVVTVRESGLHFRGDERPVGWMAALVAKIVDMR
jgi:hypothetical protein